MNKVRLTIFGTGVGLILAFAARTTLDLRRLQTSLADLSAQRAAIREKIARMETRQRGGAVAAPASTQGVAPPREEPASSGRASGTTPAARPTTAPLETAAREDNPFAAIINDSIRRAAYLADFRAGLDWTLGARFKALGLSPSVIEKIKDLEVEKRLGWLEFRAVADAHGLDWNSEGREALRQQQQKLNSARMADVLPPQLKSHWGTYGATQNVRDLVQRVASTGSYLETPVTFAQVQRTTDILVANGTPREANRFRGYAINWEAASAQLQGVLSPAQIATLGLFVQEQEAGAKVMQRIKDLTAQFEAKRAP